MRLRLRQLIAAAIACAWAVHGCHDGKKVAIEATHAQVDDPNDSTDTPSTPTADPEALAAAKQLSRALCDYFARCADIIGPLYGSAEDCVAYQETVYACDWPSADDATIARMNDCTAAWPNHPCLSPDVQLVDYVFNKDRYLPAACLALATAGTVTAGLGESCEALPCAACTYCAEVDPLSDLCPVCTALGTNDTACADDDECAAGYFCADAESDGRCTPRKENSSACARDGECVSGYCNSVANECQSLPGPGEACARDGLCAGLARVCVAGVCRDVKSAGELCTESFECAADAYCDWGVCKRLRACAAEGEACYASASPPCSGSSYCFLDSAAEAGVCDAKRSAGEDCDQDIQCAAGLFCNSVTLRCDALREPGAECQDDDQCAGDRPFCDWSLEPQVCVLRKPNGGDCTLSEHCESDYCNETSAKCEEPPPTCQQP